MGLVEANELAMPYLGLFLGMLSLTTWDGMGHSLMMEWLPCLSTQGKSGILSGKGGQGRARSNVAP